MMESSCFRDIVLCQIPLDGHYPSGSLPDPFSFGLRRPKREQKRHWGVYQGRVAGLPIIIPATYGGRLGGRDTPV